MELWFIALFDPLPRLIVERHQRLCLAWSQVAYALVKEQVSINIVPT